MPWAVIPGLVIRVWIIYYLGYSILKFTRINVSV